MDKQRKSPWLIDCKLPCLGCKYDLFQLTGPVVACPECGEVNDLRLPEQWKSHFQSLPPKRKKDKKTKYEGPLVPAAFLFPITLIALSAGASYLSYTFFLHIIILIFMLTTYLQMTKALVKTERRYGSNWVQIIASLFFRATGAFSGLMSCYGFLAWRPVVAYSIDFRLKVLSAVDEGESEASVARRFKIGERTVRRFKRLRRESGLVAPGKTGPKGPTKLTPADDAVMCEAVATRPGITANELRAMLSVQVAECTVCRRLKRLGLSLKKSR